MLKFIEYKPRNSVFIDFKKNNLHVVNYSSPINKIMKLSQLNKYLYSLKKNPKIIALII